MFIRVTKSVSGDRVYLVEGYRDTEGKIKQRILKKYGLLSDVLKKDPKSLEKLKLKIKEQKNEIDKELSIKLSSPISQAKKNKNYGYFFLESIYKELGISETIKKLSKNFTFKYDLDSIMKMLVFGRILNPASKLETVENQDIYFKKFDNKLADTYRSLEVMSKIKDDVQVEIHKNILKKYDRECSLVLYDVTNYYFESEKEDELKKPGVSKEKRKGPIVQMGLLIDSNKIPIGYKLFSGNTHDSKTAIPMIDDLRKNFNLKKIVFVADKGINTAKNFTYLSNKGDGYIVSTKIRGAKKEFINEVLSEDGYIQEGDNFKYKEILQERKVKNDDGKIVTLKEKIVIF